MTPEAIEKMKDEAAGFFDKANGTMSAQRALTMIWALRAAGLDIPIAQPWKPNGENLSRKVSAMFRQVTDSSKTHQKAEAEA